MRTQAEAFDAVVVDRWTDETAIACPPEEDKARQEFAEDADVNVILRRFGAGGFQPRPVVYGVQDTDDELQDVYTAVAEAEAGWLKLPEHLRKRYPGWPELIQAMERGEATLVDPDGVVSAPPKVELVPPVAA